MVWFFKVDFYLLLLNFEYMLYMYLDFFCVKNKSQKNLKIMKNHQPLGFVSIRRAKIDRNDFLNRIENKK